METAIHHDWHQANQRYVSAAIDLIDRYLSGSSTAAATEALGRALEAMPVPPALQTLCALFGLSPFERDVLVLCLGVELNPAVAARVAEAQTEPRRVGYPTFGMALATLPGAHWSALTPVAPLRRWRLIELEDGPSVVNARLSLHERILHYLLGVSYLDDRLCGLVRVVPVPDGLPPSQRAIAGLMAAAWRDGWQTDSREPLLGLAGVDIDGRAEVAAAACAALGLRLHALRACDLPEHRTERGEVIALWEREARLSGSALFVECDDPAHERAALAFVEDLDERVIVGGRDHLPIGRRACLRFDVARPTAVEQQTLWRASLNGSSRVVEAEIASVVQQFNLGAPAIRAASRAVKAASGANGAGADGAALWEVARHRSRTHLQDLAQRLESNAGWDDLVLPESQLDTLRQIVIHVRRRATVYQEWGFQERGARGLGISALFAGASGTGKTLAAEVVAQALRLDLYRIDLASVVSKYIGETEKNLRRVFDAAEDSGAVLLFDEADALFGKRGEVKDSHDRYANIEVSYLLQRMEMYRGLAILTTNLQAALDTAFLRRIRFIVQFPFPDVAQRVEIWQRIFPPGVPVDGLDHLKLAQLHIPGGNIRNIALSASFLAAEAGERVGMDHLLRATRGEYTKLDKSLTAAETKGWLEA